MSEQGPGRHRSTSRSRSARPVVIGIVALCVVVLGGAAWGLTAGNRGDNKAVPSDDAGTAAVSSPDTTAWTDPSEPTASSTVAESAALKELNDCRTVLRTGGEFVTAAEQNYADWSDHVYAQSDYDSGSISAKSAQAIWKHTKAAGPADLTLYVGAKKKWDKADQHACDGLKSGAGADADVVKACGMRAAAMVKLFKASGPVYDGWKAHQAQMTHSQEKSDDPNAYFKEWFGRVRSAKQPLMNYEAAAKVYQSAPKCSRASR